MSCKVSAKLNFYVELRAVLSLYLGSDDQGIGIVRLPGDDASMKYIFGWASFFPCTSCTGAVL